MHICNDTLSTVQICINMQQQKHMNSYPKDMDHGYFNPRHVFPNSASRPSSIFFCHTTRPWEMKMWQHLGFRFFPQQYLLVGTSHVFAWFCVSCFFFRSDQVAMTVYFPLKVMSWVDRAVAGLSFFKDLSVSLSCPVYCSPSIFLPFLAGASFGLILGILLTSYIAWIWISGLPAATLRPPSQRATALRRLSGYLHE